MIHHTQEQIFHRTLLLVLFLCVGFDPKRHLRQGGVPQPSEGVQRATIIVQGALHRQPWAGGGPPKAVQRDAPQEGGHTRLWKGPQGVVKVGKKGLTVGRRGPTPS